MSFIRDMFKGNIGSVVVLGVGAAILAPILIPAVRSIVKPLAKGAIKGGIMVYEKGREIVAEGMEVTEDIFHEAMAEMTEARKTAADAGTHASKEGGTVA